MRIAITADSHDNIYAIDMMCKYCEEQGINAIIHAGDIISPFSLKKFLSSFTEFYAVFGNNDGEVIELLKISGERIRRAPTSFRIDDKKFFLTHSIEGFSVKEEDYDVIVYGHTHRVKVERVKKTIVLNPGELCGYLSGNKTFVIYHTENNHVEVVKL